MIKFRPHHFLCNLGFQGNGYSPEFTENFRLINALTVGAAGDAGRVEIEVTLETDSICGPCPNRNQSRCATQDKIDRLDEAHAEILSLKDGERLTWVEALARIKKEFSLEKFHKACAPCSWKDSGYCESALRKLHGQK